MTITLKEGDVLNVEFADTDGSLTVQYTDKGLEVIANEEDDNGAVGTIWTAAFVDPETELDKTPV